MIVCNVKGGCLANLQSNLTLGSRHNCINRLVVTAPHHCCMEMHGCLAFELCDVCEIGDVAGIDGARLMKVARLRTENGNRTALKDLEKLLEEAKGSLEKKIKNRFRREDNFFGN